MTHCQILTSSLLSSDTRTDIRHIACGLADIQLAWAADFLFRIGNHLAPLRNPANGACQSKDAGKQRSRNPQRRLHDARVEIEVRKIGRAPCRERGCQYV